MAQGVHGHEAPGAAGVIETRALVPLATLIGLVLRRSHMLTPP
jgi:hypothetical protein